MQKTISGPVPDFATPNEINTRLKMAKKIAKDVTGETKTKKIIFKFSLDKPEKSKV